MTTLFNFRPSGNDVTLPDSREVKLMIIRENTRFGIFARVKGYGRVQLWTPADASAHNGDTETQMIDRLKVVM